MQHGRRKLAQRADWLTRSEHISEKARRCRPRKPKHVGQDFKCRRTFPFKGNLAVEKALCLGAADPGWIGGKLWKFLDVVSAEVGKPMSKRTKDFVG